MLFCSYNFPTNSASVGASATHLSNQKYTICFRQELGKCAICYSAVTISATFPVSPAQPVEPALNRTVK